MHKITRISLREKNASSTTCVIWQINQKMKFTNIGVTIVLYFLTETILVKFGDIIRWDFNYNKSQAYIGALETNLSVDASQSKYIQFPDDVKKNLNIDANKSYTIYNNETGTYKHIESVSFTKLASVYNQTYIRYKLLSVKISRQ